MKKRTIVLFVLLGLLVACKTATTTTLSTPSQSLVASGTSTQSPSQTFTPLLSPTLTQMSLPTLVPTSTPLPQNNLVLEQISQSGGSINGITIVGDLAYVGIGPRVEAIDISQHENPLLVKKSQPLPGLVTNLVVISGGPTPLLLVSAGKYLVVVDTSRPEKIEPIQQLELPGAISAMVLDGGEDILYAGGSIYKAQYEYSGFIAAIDITLDHHLKLVNSVALPERPISLALGEGSLYAGTEDDVGGLYHIQLETPGILSTPHLVISSTPSRYFAPYSMQVIGKRLYVGAYMEMQAYDITNPDQPVQVWLESTGIMVEGFSVEGEQIDVFGWAPAGTYLPGLDALSTPEPVTGSQVGKVASIVATHNGDFLVAYRVLDIYDTDDPQNLKLVGSYKPPVISVLGVAADKQAVYVVDNGVGDGRNNAVLRVFRLLDLKPIGKVTTEFSTSWGWFSGIAIEGDRAYVATKDGLWVYDVSSAEPTLLGKPEIVDGQLEAIAAIKLGDQRLLVTSQDVADLSVLTVYDLTDIQKPVRMGNPLTLDRGMVLQITWNGSYLYAILTAIVEPDSDLLYIVEYKNKGLALRGSLQLPGYIFSLAIDNDLIAMAGTEGLSIVSAAVPLLPQLLVQAPLPELGLRVAILKDKALVVTGGNNSAAQLLIFDIQDPANPRQDKSMDIAFSDSLIGPIPVSKPYIILASGSGGMEVLGYSYSAEGLTGCLDEQAEAVEVPARQEPLEVRFISDGNIWVWEENGSARQISDTGDVLRFTFSPDGKVIAFERPMGDYPYGQYKIELWTINRNSEGLRRLVSAEQFDEFLPGRHEAWIANVPTDYRWFSGTHRLSFGVYPYINAAGAGEAAEGYWVVDVDTLALERGAHPEVIDPYGPKKIPSPDGKVIAIVDRESISIGNADGSIIRKDALTYQANNNAEGPGWVAPKVVWAPDSLILRVLVWDKDTIEESFSTWVIPADGSPAIKMHTFSGMSYNSFISPSQDYIAYLRRVREMSSEHELHLAKFDGSEDVVYTKGYLLYFQGWVPDAFHFVYDQFNVHQPFLGSVCDDPVPLVDPNETPATQITWVDAKRFLFVVGQEGQPKELRFGQVGGESLLIGPFNGEGAYFQVRQDGQDMIVP